jgi:hypothetical protein
VSEKPVEFGIPDTTVPTLTVIVVNRPVAPPEPRKRYDALHRVALVVRAVFPNLAGEAAAEEASHLI